MKAIEFYLTQLKEKGYINTEIEETLTEELKDEHYYKDDIELHVLCILELDRVDVFKVWYGGQGEVMEWWKHHVFESLVELVEGSIEYQVEHILKKL